MTKTNNTLDGPTGPESHYGIFLAAGANGPSGYEEQYIEPSGPGPSGPSKNLLDYYINLEKKFEIPEVKLFDKII